MPPEQAGTIQIAGKEFRILDAKEYMAIPDCFVQENKVGTAHGEAKFYVGNDNEDTRRFFDNFTRTCFFTKADLRSYLDSAKAEYDTPQQEYRNKKLLPLRWQDHSKELDGFKEEILEFTIFRSKIKGPRVYINSFTSGVYKFVRKIALPQISYFSALKLEDGSGNQYYYFKPFFDYFADEVYNAIVSRKEKEIHDNKKLKPDKKNQLIQARQGQGKYREKLLNDCHFCPITLVNDERLLVASHIKPWIDSTDQEKTDHKNGFILTPTFDKLFDRGFITFEDDCTMRVSPWISPMNQSRLDIRDGKKYSKLPVAGREKYLKYHREKVFKIS